MFPKPFFMYSQSLYTVVALYDVEMKWLLRVHVGDQSRFNLLLNFKRERASFLSPK